MALGATAAISAFGTMASTLLSARPTFTEWFDEMTPSFTAGMFENALNIYLRHITGKEFDCGAYRDFRMPHSAFPAEEIAFVAFAKAAFNAFDSWTIEQGSGKRPLSFWTDFLEGTHTNPWPELSDLRKLHTKALIVYIHTAAIPDFPTRPPGEQASMMARLWVSGLRPNRDGTCNYRLFRCPADLQFIQEDAEMILQGKAVWGENVKTEADVLALGNKLLQKRWIAEIGTSEKGNVLSSDGFEDLSDILDAILFSFIELTHTLGGPLDESPEPIFPYFDRYGDDTDDDEECERASDDDEDPEAFSDWSKDD